MASCKSQRPDNGGGFALLATIWALAALVLFVGFFAHATSVIQDGAFFDRQQARARMDLLATESTIIYLGATRRMSYAGLTLEDGETRLRDEFNPFSTDMFSVRGNEIRLDGRPYKALGESRFSIQDTGGLTSLRLHSAGGNVRLARLLAAFGIEGNRAALLMGTLADYVDRGDLVSLNGAERADYERRKMLAPTNRYLAAPTQIANVLEWKEALGDRYPEFLDEVTSHTGNKDNFNTMTRRGMLAQGDMSDAAVDRIFEHRRGNAFTSLADVNEVAGVLISTDILGFGSVPASFMRLKVWSEASGQEEWIGVRFTPVSDHAPWQIEYRVDRVRRPPSTIAHNQIEPNASNDPGAPESALFRQEIPTIP